jgi:hypothetical protein
LADAFESWLDCASTIYEEFNSGGRRQSGHRYEDLAGNTQGFTARSYETKTGHPTDQSVGDRGSLGDNVLAIVEDDHQRTASEVPGY